MTSVFASFLRRIGPRAGQVKLSPSTRAAGSLWNRLLGNASEEEVVDTEQQASPHHACREPSSPTPDEETITGAVPVTSPAARQQLEHFVQEMRVKTRTKPPTGIQSPFATLAGTGGTTSTPEAPVPAPVPPVSEDLRVPRYQGSSEMIHLAQ